MGFGPSWGDFLQSVTSEGTVSFGVVRATDWRHIFTGDSSDDIFGGSSQEFGDDRKLVNV